MLTIPCYNYFPKHSSLYNYIQHEYGNLLNSLYNNTNLIFSVMLIFKLVPIYSTNMWGRKTWTKTKRLNSGLLANSTLNLWPPHPKVPSLQKKRILLRFFQSYIFPTPIPNLPFISSMIFSNFLNFLSFHFLVFKIEVLVPAEEQSVIKIKWDNVPGTLIITQQMLVIMLIIDLRTQWYLF